jgi:hypothetical protein
MKTSCPTIALCVIALVSNLALEAQAPSIIEPKVERHEGPPFWISAEAVADAKKVIDLDKIDSISLRASVERQRREIGDPGPADKSVQGERPSVVPIPVSECKHTQSVADERGGTGSTATLSELASNSRTILRGTVRTVDLGFDSGVPGSLLGVEVLEVIKGHISKPLIYILYPVARFKIGPFHFCNATKGFEPHEGDAVLLFDFTGPGDRNDVLFAPRMDQIVFQTQSGSLFLPAQLKNSPDLKTAHSLSDVVAHLASAGAPGTRCNSRDYFSRRRATVSISSGSRATDRAAFSLVR